MNIPRIIRMLDDFIKSSNLEFLPAVEAARILDHAGVLKDRPERPGAPLRVLLREGRLPHAYQAGGKGSEWRIPFSGKCAEDLPIYSATSPRPHYSRARLIPHSEKLLPGLEESHSIASRIRKAREAYLPQIIKCLLVAEAPPEALDRFFYYPDVQRADYLFLGVMGVLDQASKKEYLSSGRSPELKIKLLNNFMDRGFYLTDICEVPLGVYGKTLADAVPDMIRNISKIIDLETPIVLIKGTVFDLVAKPLADAGYVNVVQERIPFPVQGWQQKFHEKFSVALKNIGM